MAGAQRLRQAEQALRDEAEAVAEAQIAAAEKSSVLLSTGSTLLDLACGGGLSVGRYFLVVGDAAAGKTFLGMSCIAEAANNPAFDDYRLIYDNVEDGCLLPVARLFGERAAGRIEPPCTVNGEPQYSSTVEDFYFNLDDCMAGDKRVLYVLDSMDALTASADDKYFDKTKAAARAGKSVAGTYGTDKPKLNSEGLRRALKRLRHTGSILIIMAQTRDNLGFGFTKKTRSGGHALKFYATLEIWVSVVGHEKRTVNDREHTVGTKVKWVVKKNRVTGLIGAIEFTIFPSYGIDDIGSCVDYLVAEKWWKLDGKKILVPWADEKPLSRSGVIQKIEEADLVGRLREEVSECWASLEQRLALNRKARYE